MKMDFLKYLTPQLVTMLTVFGILGIVIILSLALLIILRKKPFVQKIIWNLREFRNLISNTPSYYSQKRIKASIAFYSGIGLILVYDAVHFTAMSAAEVAAHAVILFGVAGYHVSKTQEEKLMGGDDDDVVVPALPVVSSPVVPTDVPPTDTPPTQ
jgi:hypothetical protein